nr:efflux RND transporter periplasmic adaptor subunit [Bacteroidota bacterium]
MISKKLLINNVKNISRNFIFFMVAGLVIYSCSGTVDDMARLQELKKQRDNLDKEIRVIEQKITAEGKAIDPPSKVPAVVGQKMEPELFSHFIEVRGNVESDNNIFVPALRPYVVKRILVNEGDQVKKGQLLAELDNESITQTIKEIKNGLELTTTLFERQKNLWEKKIGTEVQYLQAKSSMEDLQIKLKNAENELEKTKIYSPIDGIVDLVDIKEGEAAAPNTGAIRVSNLSSQKVKAKVAENFITDVKKGDRIKVYLPTINLHLDSKITAASQIIDPNNRTFDIEVKLPDDDRINPNMLAILTINDYADPNAFVLPINALQKSESRTYIYVAQKNGDHWITQLRDVETGRYNNDKVEITSGLNSGDVVITFGFNNASVGDPVDVSFTKL